MDLESARHNQLSYRPNNEIASQLGALTVLLFVGPAGVGKSSTLDMISECDPRFGRTGSIGTRPPDARDQPGAYTQYSEKDLLEKIDQRSLVQYAVHPTTNSIYATTIDRYKHAFNMLEALPASIDYFHGLQFGNVQTFYMVTEPSAWQQWFTARYPDNSTERQKRLKEATSSLEWSLQQPDESLTWVVNTPGTQNKTAQHVIAAATQNNIPDTQRNLAKAMLAAARQLEDPSQSSYNE